MKTRYTVCILQSTIKLYSIVITKKHKYCKLIPKREKDFPPTCFNVLVIFYIHAVTKDIYNF